jgi:DNA-directed RNA polymerase I subunit RPA1
VTTKSFFALISFCQVVVRGGELVQGVLDKGQIGASEFGLVHAVFELYGAQAAPHFLNALGRLLTGIFRV